MLENVKGAFEQEKFYQEYNNMKCKVTVDGYTNFIFINRFGKLQLFTYFKSHNIKITNPYNGIYYVMGSVLFPTQIIVGRELDKKSYVWLNRLLVAGGDGRRRI